MALQRTGNLIGPSTATDGNIATLSNNGAQIQDSGFSPLDSYFLKVSGALPSGNIVVSSTDGITGVSIAEESSISINTSTSIISGAGAAVNPTDVLTQAAGDARYEPLGGGANDFAPTVYSTHPTSTYLLFASNDTNILTVQGVPFANGSGGTNWVSFDLGTQTYTALFSGLAQINFGLSVNIGQVSSLVAAGFYISYNFIVNGATVQGNVGGRPSRIYIDENVLTRPNRS